MKQRTITGIIIAIFVIPFIIFGQYFIAAFVGLLSLLSVKEFLDIKKKSGQEKTPLYVYIICMLFSLLLIFDIYVISDYGFNFANATLQNYGLNTLWVMLLAISLFTSSVFDKKFSIIDAFYSFATTIFLSLGLKGMLYLRLFGEVDKVGILLLAYVLLVSCLTDIFAYFGGMTCYKLLGSDKVHKLNERISPKKTIEGCLVGTIIGTLLGFVFAFFLLKDLNFKWYLLLIMSLALSLAGQIGDLILSANKRHFNVKDYSNLLPGHGGVLDRIDSLLVNCMIAATFISLIA